MILIEGKYTIHLWIYMHYEFGTFGISCLILPDILDCSLICLRILPWNPGYNHFYMHGNGETPVFP